MLSAFFVNRQPLPAQVSVLLQPRRHVSTSFGDPHYPPYNRSRQLFHSRCAPTPSSLRQIRGKKWKKKETHPAECRSVEIGKKHPTLSVCFPAVAHSRLNVGRNKRNVVTAGGGNGITVTAGHPYIDKLLATTVALIVKPVSSSFRKCFLYFCSAHYFPRFSFLSDVTHLRMAKLRISVSILRPNIIRDEFTYSLRYRDIQSVFCISFWRFQYCLYYSLNVRYMRYFVNFNCKIKFVQFPRSSSPCTIMAERPSGTRSYRTSRRFSKKRNKFHTIELRNRGSHPLRVLSSLEGIIPRYRASQADSIDSFTT